MARKKKEVELADVSDVEVVLPEDQLRDLDVTEVEAAIEAGEKLELVEEDEKEAPTKETSLIRPKMINSIEETVPAGTFGIFFR